MSAQVSLVRFACLVKLVARPIICLSLYVTSSLIVAATSTDKFSGIDADSAISRMESAVKHEYLELSVVLVVEELLFIAATGE